MYYLHKKGKIVEYSRSETFHGKIEYRAKSKFLDQLPVFFFDWEFEVLSKDQALQAAMDYHETEGCKLYFELHPAPEKDGWNYIAQNASGKWHGYDCSPNPSISSWFTEKGEEFPMIQSPPNPFWRKTLR